MVKPPGISGGAVLLGRRPGWRSREAVGTPSFSWTRRAASTPGLATSTLSGCPASPASASYWRGIIGPPHRAIIIPLRKGCQRSGSASIRPTSATVTSGQNSMPEGVRAGAVGFRGGQGDPVPAGVERGPEPDVREDVPVGAHGRQDDVHAGGPSGFPPG